MSLQSLFPELILEQKALDPGYSGHASDVWLVRTAAEEVVVRASRMTGEPDNDFWWGARDLFGIDPRRVHALVHVNNRLNELSPIPVPRVLRTGEVAGREHVVVGRMPGKQLPSFSTLSDVALRQLGDALARIHSRGFDWCGAPDRSLAYAPAAFHGRLIGSMRAVVARFCQGQPEIEGALAPMCEAAAALPAVDAGALIMIDMDPSQFLYDGEQLTALVDTEAYAVGPRALDLIALEYVLDPRSAAAVADGYSGVLPLPDLTAVRPVYRYYYRLLRIQGRVPLDDWLAHPALFG